MLTNRSDDRPADLQSPETEQDAVFADNVTKTYGRSDRATAVFNDLSLGVKRGAFTTIVGPSGCGKSTLLNLIAGFESPTAGALYSGGAAISAPGPERLMVFQNALAALFPWMSTERNVVFGLEQAHKRWDKDRIQEATKRCLSLVGLWEHRAKPPGQLSGGMQQRLQLARALAIDPDVLLMDEPFGALDAQTRETLSGELIRLWKATSPRKTIIFITHDIDEAIRIGTRVVVMAPGKGIVGDFDASPFGFDNETDGAGYAEMRMTIKQLLGRGAL